MWEHEQYSKHSHITSSLTTGIPIMKWLSRYWWPVLTHVIVISIQFLLVHGLSYYHHLSIKCCKNYIMDKIYKQVAFPWHISCTFVLPLHVVECYKWYSVIRRPIGFKVGGSRWGRGEPSNNFPSTFIYHIKYIK